MTVLIISLIAIGLVLVLIEIIFIPGTTFVGLLGVLFTLAGIIFGYREFGSATGHIILATTTAAFGGLVYYSFRSDAWGRFALKQSIDSKNNEGYLESFSVGEQGICVSALRPIGKAEFNNRTVEVSSLGEYIDAGTKVCIKEVSAAGIIVEQNV